MGLIKKYLYSIGDKLCIFLQEMTKNKSQISNKSHETKFEIPNLEYHVCNCGNAHSINEKKLVLEI